MKKILGGNIQIPALLLMIKIVIQKIQIRRKKVKEREEKRPKKRQNKKNKKFSNRKSFLMYRVKK